MLQDTKDIMKEKRKHRVRGKGLLFYTSVGTIVEGGVKRKPVLCEVIILSGCLLGCQVRLLKKCVHSKHNQDESINHTKNVFVPPSAINN